MSDSMMFPNDWAKFLEDYSFRDDKEVYTNGARLIPTFRVEQMMHHYLRKAVTDNNVGSKWIPVSERLPGIHDDVLMYFKDDDNMTVGYLDDVDEDRTMWTAYSDGGYFTDCDYEPTHWMPLPEPPKEVESNE